MTPPLVFTKASCLFMAGLPPHAGQVGESARTSQGGGGTTREGHGVDVPIPGVVLFCHAAGVPLVCRFWRAIPE